jgi:hypothetical protein
MPSSEVLKAEIPALFHKKFGVELAQIINLSTLSIPPVITAAFTPSPVIAVK